MVEEATRRLLKVFGIAVTEFEESAQEILGQTRATVAQGGAAEALLPLLERFVKVEGDLMGRWAELSRHVSETQERAHGELVRLIEQAQKR